MKVLYPCMQIPFTVCLQTWFVDLMVSDQGREFVNILNKELMLLAGE